MPVVCAHPVQKRGELAGGGGGGKVIAASSCGSFRIVFHLIKGSKEVIQGHGKIWKKTKL